MIIARINIGRMLRNHSISRQHPYVKASKSLSPIQRVQIDINYVEDHGPRPSREGFDLPIQAQTRRCPTFARMQQPKGSRALAATTTSKKLNELSQLTDSEVQCFAVHGQPSHGSIHRLAPVPFELSTKPIPRLDVRKICLSSVLQ